MLDLKAITLDEVVEAIAYRVLNSPLRPSINEKTEIRCVNCNAQLTAPGGEKIQTAHFDKDLPFIHTPEGRIYARCGPCYGMAQALSKRGGFTNG